MAKKEKCLFQSKRSYSHEISKIIRGGGYSSLIVNGAALTRGQRLFQARHLLEEILYLYKRILG